MHAFGPAKHCHPTDKNSPREHYEQRFSCQGQAADHLVFNQPVAHHSHPSQSVVLTCASSNPQILPM
jgi:hypothetical protein